MSGKPYRTLNAYRLRHTIPGSPFYEKASLEDIGHKYQLSVPNGWTYKADDAWSYYYPPSIDIPDQGWKIHVSAVPDREIELLQAVSNHLFSRQTPFKHLVSDGLFLRSNSKYADRGSSGKFITVYPSGDSDFCELLDELEDLTGSFDGPYILSDTKYKEGPVFFRYGGFKYSIMLDEDGLQALAIHDEDGTLVKDVREPRFVVPDFVAIPKKITKQVASRLHPDKAELDKGLYPYRVERSLHFSNGGGVYLAVNTLDGSRAVLKEARRFAGFTSRTEDACVRLRHERDVLKQLGICDFVPKILAYLRVADHEFLAESYIEGVSLQSWIASEYPFSLESNRVAGYYAKAAVLRKSIVEVVDAVHSYGLALMDISPNNFLVTPDLNVYLVDFEGFRKLDASDVGVLGTPGFMPMAGCVNSERDSYGLLCLLLYLWAPSWTNSFSPETLLARARRVASLFPTEEYRQISSLISKVPKRLLEPRLNYYQLGYREDSCLDDVVSALASGVAAMRMAGRTSDRLYPGDATQFLHDELGMLDIETGATGIALMLSRTGADVSADMQWILDGLRHLSHPARFHGLLRGEVGIISALVQMGYEEAVQELLPASLPDVPVMDVSVRTGLAGTVLALLDIYDRTGSATAFSLLREASNMLKYAIDEDKDPISPASETGNAFGLFDGWCGAAIACRELSFAFGKERVEWLNRMNLCLSRDLEKSCLSDEDSRYVSYAGVNFGYLSEGSAGLLYALALCAPLEHGVEIKQIEKSLRMRVALNGTLFHGIGGIVASLLPVCGPHSSRIQTLLRETVGCFFFRKADATNEWYTLGDGGACLSADYSSGSAGLIGVLLSVKEDPTKWFPVSLHLPAATTQEREEV